jgi:beta-1,4-N-acetylglucosaminyltransferase
VTKAGIVNRRTQQLAQKSVTNKKKINIALVCTRGGHFEQMTNLSEFYGCYDHFWITNRNKQTESQLKQEKVYYVDLAHFKKPWTYVYQIAPVLRMFIREKPSHVLSTGSGRTAFIPFLLSKLFRIKFIYIDTFSRVNGHSKFGTFLLRTKNRIYTQWKDPHNDRAVFIGPIFKQQESFNKSKDSNYIFITLGTRDEPFTRLTQGVEDLVKKGIIK